MRQSTEPGKLPGWTLLVSLLGWIRGSERTYFGREVVDAPADRVLTVRYHDENSGYSAHQFHSEEWRSPDGATVQALLDKHGPAPAGQ